MKPTKSIILLMTVGCLCSFVFPINNAHTQGAQIKPEMKFHGTKIIRITSDEILRSTLTIDSGTTVVWLNNGRNMMEVNFLDKQVTLACGAPEGFFVNDKGIFNSEKILPNGVASLCFIEKGEYDYEAVQRPLRSLGSGGSLRNTFKGKIIVK